MTPDIDQILRRVRQLEALVPATGAAAGTGSGGGSGLLLSKQFITAPDVIENTFPLQLALPAGIVPTFVFVGNVVNVSTGAIVREGVFVHWSAGSNLGVVPPLYWVNLLFITGLEPAAEYRITFQVLSSGVIAT